MTPQGFDAWVDAAARGDRIMYYQGDYVSKAPDLRDAAYAAYEMGRVLLFQTRLTPTVSIDNKTVGTFVWWAQKCAT